MKTTYLLAVLFSSTLILNKSKFHKSKTIRRQDEGDAKKEEADKEEADKVSVPVRTNLPSAANGKKWTLPENLTDGNQDGKVDEGDFIRGWANLEMTAWEIQQIFVMADFNKQGNLDMQQWKLFRNMFVKKFEALDTENTLYLKKDKILESLQDVPGVQGLIEDKETNWEQIINDLSRRAVPKGEEDSLNFYEWMFLRQVCVAWTISAGNRKSINRDELLDIALKIMPHFTAYEGQIKQVIFQAIDFKGFYTQYTLIDAINVLQAFVIFESMRKHSSVAGVLDYNHFLRAIEDGVGPTSVFEIADQDKMFNLEQAFALREDDEQIGIDYINFYFLLRTIRAVKFYAKTKSGSLTEDEWKKLIGEHSMFFQMNKYAEDSEIMSGDQKIQKDYTVESEAYFISQGTNQPMQYRFKQDPSTKDKFINNQINKQKYPMLNKVKQMKLAQKIKRREEPAEKKDDALDFTVDEKDKLKYFYEMYKNHVYDHTMTWGDLFRLFKYYRRFQAWDSDSGTRTLRIMPNQLTKNQMMESNGMFFAAEKDIIKNMHILYVGTQKLDRILYDLPIDYLSFTRFFAWKQLVLQVAKQTDYELISLKACYQIYKRMGLIPVNADLSKWTKDLTQGMNNFKPLQYPSEGINDAMRFINGWKAYESLQIRMSYQMAGIVYFQDKTMVPNYNSFSQTMRRKMRRRNMRRN